MTRPWNPYVHLLDDETDRDEHNAEVRAGMAIAWHAVSPGHVDRWWSAAKAIDDHRRARAELQAQLAAEALEGAA